MRRAAVGLALLLSALVAGDAGAWVPPAYKLYDRVARANRQAGRGTALILSVALRGPGGRDLGSGEVLVDPRGLARMELGTAFGGAERHLLRGGQYAAARGGSPVAVPPRLPPLFLLLADTADRVRSGLLSLGGVADEVVLGREDGTICWVLGGRDLAPPANASAAEAGTPGPKASLWVTRDAQRIVRIDRLDGTRYLLGPPRSHDGIVLPEWVHVEYPQAPAERLEILGVRRGRFDLATAFGDDWLLGR